MTTPKKMLCNVRTLSSKNKVRSHISKLLITIYEHYMYKQECKRIFNIVSGVKHKFFVCLATCNVCYEV